ncbi:MAG TPA: helix-turn-helix domain-containing protein [Firmicutes bacterium]|nr:helix-turn-helix domain-containing protein [Bacillota bacterium]
MENAVRERRERLNIRVEDLARDAGVTPTFIYMVETGSRVPSLPTARRIAESLRTTVDALFFEPILTQSEKRGRTQ